MNLSCEGTSEKRNKNGRPPPHSFVHQILTLSTLTITASSSIFISSCRGRFGGLLFVILFALQCILCKGCSLETVTVDIGSNVSFPCEAQGAILWVREGQWINPSQDSMVDALGILHLLRVRTNDAGLYECQADSPDNYSHPCPYIQRVNLTIRTPPPALNVTVHPSTVLALVMWHVVDDGGYPLTSIHVQYRETEDTKGAWLRTIPDRVGPATNLMEVYNLQPNTSYSFRVWAVNGLGSGVVTEVNTTTKPGFDNAVKLVDAARNFNPKVWLTAVLCVLIVFGVGLSALAIFLIKDRLLRSRHTRLEVMEMVPHIIANPVFDLDLGLHDQAVGGFDENLNDQQLLLENNNSVVRQPH